MLRAILAAFLALVAFEVRAQSGSLAVTDVTRRVVGVTSYCGSVRADWAAFQPYVEQFSGRQVERSVRTVEFMPITHVEIVVSDLGEGRLQCSTFTVRPDASEYVTQMGSIMGEWPQYFGGPPDENWVWPISPSSPEGRRGWRWVMVTREPMDNTAIIAITYYSYTP